MGKYDFDTVRDRRGTCSLKYDTGPEIVGRQDLLPMWVADMDFALPGEVLDELHKRTDHGIFGYTMPDDRYAKTLEGWFLRHYGWKPDRKWNTVVPGVVYGITLAVRAMTEPGETVMIQEPVYYPFRGLVESNGRKVVNSPLLEKNGRYEMDLADFESKIIGEDVRVFILCSPHNPVGRVWTREELEEVISICRKHNVKIIADEIHCDIIYPGNSFVSVANLAGGLSEDTVLCTSPSKTFNIAGLQISNILIPDPELRKAFRREHDKNGVALSSALGLTAAEAAYRLGDRWLSELLDYLQGNLDYFREFLKNEIPCLRLVEPEGTYLVWVDCSGLTDDSEKLYSFMKEEAGLWLDDGGIFGRNGELFERFNIACPRSVLKQALNQLKEAVDRMGD